MAEHVFISGPASWNRLVYLDHLPEPVPHMQFASEEYETLGGTSAGKALGLVGLGRPVVLHTLLGTDPDGERVRRVLTDSGIRLIAPESDATERHINLMTRAGERVSLYLSSPTSPGAAADDELMTAMTDAAALVLDLSVRSRDLLPAARATGVPIWTDLHDYDGESEFHRPFLEGADAVFMNADSLPGDPWDFLETTVQGGATLAVCTLGARGAIAVSASASAGDSGRRMRRHEVPAVPVVVRDTNGAGDAFMSAVLDATLGGADVDAALRAGAAHAATVLPSRHLHPSLDALLGA
ncbi:MULTISPECIES: carbohydrate kinase family protein [unclassified Leifsonia]|uniref:carbohydrate kinase family protein n=1 Tax=unclassified Leifsonia TaxID=2663824 RepID=UPI0006FD22C8|nr:MULTISPECIES: carbohydrate kinase family protein [unclassified Leifsonia]KQX05186.1 carbohydrate kinase [Leifsonia sp. Root1293]KRA08819.1 carbohydrate kinase [Leifsonia sp. Root60]